MRFAKSNMFEEIKNIKSDKKELKKFGLSVGIVVFILGIILFACEKSSFLYFLIIGGVLILSGVLLPKFLLPFQKIWMIFAVIMGFAMTRIILAVLFYLIITPISLITKLLRKDFLNLKIEKEKSSYWNMRDEEYSKNSTEKQF
jgi:multisubunit Na+/H+ antiporter MnhG subunit